MDLENDENNRKSVENIKEKNGIEGKCGRKCFEGTIFGGLVVATMVGGK